MQQLPVIQNMVMIKRCFVTLHETHRLVNDIPGSSWGGCYTLRVLRSVNVSSAAPFLLVPKTVSISRWPNSRRSSICRGRCSMLVPSLFLCCRVRFFLVLRDTFKGRSMFLIGSRPRSISRYRVLVQTHSPSNKCRVLA